MSGIPLKGHFSIYKAFEFRRAHFYYYFFRFTSRYYYRRQFKSNTQMFLSLMNLVEPDLMSSWPDYVMMPKEEKRIFEQTFREKPLEDCIVNGDLECRIENGTIWDSSIVCSWENILLSHKSSKFNVP